MFQGQFLEFMMALIDWNMEWRGDASEFCNVLSEKIANLSRNAIQLFSNDHKVPELTVSRTLVPVYYDMRYYGTLLFSDMNSNVTTSDKYRLAKFCGWCLHHVQGWHNMTCNSQTLASKKRIQEKIARLTVREREILLLMTNELAPHQIAISLVIGRRTVEKHQQHIYDKLEVQSYCEASSLGKIFIGKEYIIYGS